MNLPIHTVGALTRKKRKAMRPNRQLYDRVVLASNETEAPAGAITKLELITIPRFKESDLSGSQWRISAGLKVYSLDKSISLGKEDLYAGNVRSLIDELYHCTTFEKFLDTYDLDREAEFTVTFKMRKNEVFSSSARTMRKAIAEAFRANHREFEFPRACPLDKDDEEMRCDQEGCSRNATVTYLLKHDHCSSCGRKYEWESNGKRTFCEVHDNRGTQGSNDCMRNYETLKQ